MGTVATLKREAHGNVLQVLEELETRGYVVTAMTNRSKLGNAAFTIEYYQPQNFQEQGKLFEEK